MNKVSQIIEDSLDCRYRGVDYFTGDTIFPTVVRIELCRQAE